MATLRDIDERYQALLEMGENGILDEETFTDTLEGITGEREEKLNSCAAVLLELNAAANALQDEQARLRDRLRAVKARQDWLKRYVQAHGGVRHGQPARVPLGTWSVRKSERVVVTDDPPLDYCHAPAPLEPDKKKIKRALDAGTRFDWAHIDDNETVQFR